MITLTEEQERVVNWAVDRLLARNPLTTIGGYAGTGKTTITGHIVDRLRPKKIAFACYTGKAKGVLESKLRATKSLIDGDSIGTIHSLVYSPIPKEKREMKDGKEHISTWAEFSKRYEDEFPYDVIIIDEASMVSQMIFEDLSEIGVPILAIGDHNQLPPVGSKFNLMAEPMARLETIHRQAKDNPIIQLSVTAREIGEIPHGFLTADIGKTIDGTIVNRLAPNIEDWTILCGTNKKRVRINKFIRDKKFTISPETPQIGEKVICLQNNHKVGIFNGMIGTIKKIEIFEQHWYLAEIDMVTHTYYGKIFRYQFNNEKTCKDTMLQCENLHPEEFGDLFDYAYCLSVWKAQGSEFDNVVFYEEQNVRRWIGKDFGRFIYTALTRSKKRLIVIEC